MKLKVTWFGWSDKDRKQRSIKIIPGLGKEITTDELCQNA